MLLTPVVFVNWWFMLIKPATQENKISLFQHLLLFSNYNARWCEYHVTIVFPVRQTLYILDFKQQTLWYKSRCLLSKDPQDCISSSHQPWVRASFISVPCAACRGKYWDHFSLLDLLDLQEDEILKIEAKHGWSLCQMLMCKEQSAPPWWQ